MLLTYTTTSKTVTTGNNLPLDIVAIQTGCTATHIAGSNVIELNKPGFYKVEFNAVASSAGTSGNIIVQMGANNGLYAGALCEAQSTGTTDIENLSFSTIVQVVPNTCCNTSKVPMSLIFENIGIGAIFTNINVVVTKIA